MPDKKNKKKRSKSKARRTGGGLQLNAAAVGIIAVIALVVFGIAMYDRISGGPGESFGVELYFPNKATSELQAEKRSIRSGDKEAVLLNVMSELRGGPKSMALSGSVPKEVAVTLLSYDPGALVLDIHVSEEYRELDLIDELFFRSSLVWTFTGLDFVSGVKITVGEGELAEELTKPGGQPMGIMSRDNMLLDSGLAPVNVEYQTLKLYFPDENGMGLELEERTIPVNPNSAEVSIMQELIKGPFGEGRYSAIPPDTKLRSVKIEEGGTCYVDLNLEFLAKIQQGATTESMAIYSIVNSLTELSNVKRVQFLFDGKKEEIKDGNLEISAPFERNEGIILY